MVAGAEGRHRSEHCWGWRRIQCFAMVLVRCKRSSPMETSVAMGTLEREIVPPRLSFCCSCNELHQIKLLLSARDQRRTTHGSDTRLRRSVLEPQVNTHTQLCETCDDKEFVC